MKRYCFAIICAHIIAVFALIWQEKWMVQPLFTHHQVGQLIVILMLSALCFAIAEVQ